MENKFCFAIYDKYPVNEGHVLVVTRRHIGDYFELGREEADALWKMIGEAKQFIEEKYKPDGFNVGFNLGETAGQTIDHVHIHVIPRYSGDMEDPTGGVRNVIPERGRY